MKIRLVLFFFQFTFLFLFFPSLSPWQETALSHSRRRIFSPSLSPSPSLTPAPGSFSFPLYLLRFHSIHLSRFHSDRLDLLSLTLAVAASTLSLVVSHSGGVALLLLSLLVWRPLLLISGVALECNNKDVNNDRIGDANLASDLAAEVAKMNTHHVQREASIKKIRELLFTELCSYLDLETEEVMKKWSEMEKEEKWVLVKEFVNEWGANFHPLSARSVQEMIEEYVHEGKYYFK